MAMNLTSEIVPKGINTEEILADLVCQLQKQNKELQVIIQDLYKKIEEGRSK